MGSAEALGFTDAAFNHPRRLLLRCSAIQVFNCRRKVSKVNHNTRGLVLQRSRDMRLSFSSGLRSSAAPFARNNCRKPEARTLVNRDLPVRCVLSCVNRSVVNKVVGHCLRSLDSNLIGSIIDPVGQDAAQSFQR